MSYDVRPRVSDVSVAAMRLALAQTVEKLTGDGDDPHAFGSLDQALADLQDARAALAYYRDSCIARELAGMATELAKPAPESTAKNYVAITFDTRDADRPYERAVVALVRRGGKAPSELVDELKALLRCAQPMIGWDGHAVEEQEAVAKAIEEALR